VANVNVTYLELEGAAARLATGQGELEDKLTVLKSMVDDLISQGFQTDRASGAFATAYDDFTTGAKTTIGGIEQMCAFLRRAAENFTSTDESLASSLG
jgi:WXG100 family type VII secretion target